MKLAIIGDSLGMDRETEPEGTPRNLVWPMLIANGNRTFSIINKCQRARMMCSVPEDLLRVIAAGADVIVIQVGVVDCAPRVFSKADQTIFDQLSDVAHSKLLPLVKEQRVNLINNYPLIVYLELSEFAEYVSKIVKYAMYFEVPIIFVSIIRTKTMDSKLPGWFGRAFEYNRILQNASKHSYIYFFDADSCFADQGNGELYCQDCHHMSTYAHSFFAENIIKFFEKEFKCTFPLKQAIVAIRRIFISRFFLIQYTWDKVLRKMKWVKRRLIKICDINHAPK